MSELIDFTDEQSMLLETAAEFCRNHSPIEKVRAALDAEAVDLPLWKEMTELGWLAINVPEEHGGLGLGIASVVPVVESMGRYLMSSPYIGTVLAAETLVKNGSEIQQAHWLPKLVGGSVATLALTEEDGSWQLDDMGATGTLNEDQIILSGRKCFVTDADVAEMMLASVNIDGAARMVILERGQIADTAITREIVIDQTRRSFQVDLDGIEIGQPQLLPGADFKALELASMLLLCAEISGGLVGVLHTIVEYLNTRKAFGRTIGSYQSLKHPSADILLSLEAARSHLYHAATTLGSGPDEAAEVAIRMAKAQGSEAFAFASDRAIQFHGGFGFTFECDAQLYLRRALWCQYQFGDEHYHRQLLESQLLDVALPD